MMRKRMWSSATRSSGRRCWSGTRNGGSGKRRRLLRAPHPQPRLGGSRSRTPMRCLVPTVLSLGLATCGRTRCLAIPQAIPPTTRLLPQTTPPTTPPPTLLPPSRPLQPLCLQVPPLPTLTERRGRPSPPNHRPPPGLLLSGPDQAPNAGRSPSLRVHTRPRALQRCSGSWRHAGSSSSGSGRNMKGSASRSGSDSRREKSADCNARRRRRRPRSGSWRHR
mmetsp:Transcript_137803/g.239688  ORF Transcript_137803/g.239688 Transcript_137803/m.239688 type:complete len:221 (+) Transcript_137803:91-753(+)